MTLTISPELEQRILRAARDRGVSPDALVNRILEDEIRPEPQAAGEWQLPEPIHGEHPTGWPGQLETREDLKGEHPIYQAPATRPDAHRVASALRQLASTDRPLREYPEDFFSRRVIYADQG